MQYMQITIELRSGATEVEYEATWLSLLVFLNFPGETDWAKS